VSKFTKFPKMWQEQLARIRAEGSTYRVALYLLDQAGFNPTTREVPLSTARMRKLSVSRNGKRNAIKQLRRAGLVAVEERPRKSPIVTVRFAP
jgi:hypothetical protein